MNKSTRKERIDEFHTMAVSHLPSVEKAYRLTTTLDHMGFFDAPASTRFHGNYAGGLYDHSMIVCEKLLDMRNDLNLTWENPRSPFIVGMLHDLCKVDSYRFDDESGTFKHADTLLTGHGEKSVMLLNKLSFMEFTDEEIACIRYHMGAFTDSKEWSSYTGAIHAYPNVLWTHTADMVAAHIVGV